MAVFANGVCTWEPCIVVDYDSARNCYAVKEVAAIGDAQDLHWVPRVHLYFAAEDPFIFAKRYTDAVAARARAESLLRYSLFIDSMPIEDLPPISTEQVNTDHKLHLMSL
jgi:dynein heavy chain